MYQAKLWATQVFKLAKMKGNSQQTPSISTPQSCAATHSHPKTEPPFGHQTACTDRHCASEKQPAKANHSSVACFEHEIY